MENTTTETKTNPETKAPPVAAAPPVSEPKPAPAPTATTTVTPPAPAEKPQPSGEPKPDAKDIARRAFQDREQKREKKASEELAAARKRIAELEARQPKSEPEAPPSFIDDPEGALKRTKEETKREVMEQLQRDQELAQEKAEYHQTTEKAANFLLTRSHLKEDRALLDEVLKVVEKDYAHLAAVDGGRDPGAAAELAYIRVCQAKGIMPDLDGFKSPGFDATKGAASIGARHSAPAGEKKTWSKREAEKYLMDAAKKPADFKARSAEIEEAKKEGRIK